MHEILQKTDAIQAEFWKAWDEFMERTGGLNVLGVAARIIYHGLQPFLLAGSYALWVYLDRDESALLFVLLGSYSVLTLCERFFPAHADWEQSSSVHASVLSISIVCLIAAGVIAALHSALLTDPLTSLRQEIGVSTWPSGWPLLAQVLLLYFSSEFVFYWIHRGLHRHKILWRATGHGFHHSFRHMHSVNFMTSHPFDLILLSLPLVLVSRALGADPEVSVGASLLILVNGFFAHSNISANMKILGWLFTTPAHHQLHHSNVLYQSNTNYSCNAIVWDRLFGTFCDEPMEQTGIGPIEPTLGEKLLLPIREPEYTTTAP